MEELKNVGYPTRKERIELAQNFRELHAHSVPFAYQQYVATGGKMVVITQIDISKQESIRIRSDTFREITNTQ